MRSAVKSFERGRYIIELINLPEYLINSTIKIKGKGTAKSKLTIRCHMQKLWK